MSIVSVVDMFKFVVEEKKFIKGESEEEIKIWCEEFDKYFEKVD